MKGLHWERVEEIFGKAMHLMPEQRQEYLDEACGVRTELRRQVEALLRADQTADGFLEDIAEFAHFSALAAPLEMGKRLGAYRVVRRIGEGGMGTVYLAERDDATFTRRVAIKVLRQGTESASAMQRLERERQILADLDHPGIARLLDGGTTAAGLPYVVMEYVDGEPIDRACRRLELGPTERVGLMLSVCEAVTAAHRQLVVHRDLKPSNILIDTEGQTKLLDFGIAKLLENNELGAPLEATESWDRRLTPSYASPEQLRGERITVATDVYLLGVVLYNLLAGEPPYRFEGESLIDIERRVTTQMPKPPSALAPGLDGDLDAIVLKALRSDPADRYGSVEAMAEDLRRYRAGLPVMAQQGTFRYLAGKFLQRHWLALGILTTFLLLVAGFGLFTAMQGRQIERTLGRLVAVEGFVVDLFEAADPYVAQDRRILVQEVLERGERQLELGEGLEPGSRGLLHALFGRISLHLGQVDKARSHLKAALTAYGEVADDPFFQLATIRAKADLARALLYVEENPGPSENLALEALEEGRQALEGDAEGLLDLLNNLATIYCLQGKWDSAEPLVDEAYGLFTGHAEVPGLQQAVTLSMKAMLLMNKGGKPDEARRLYEQSLAIYRDIEGSYHPDIAGILNQLGLLARESGDYEGAAARFRESLGIRRELYPEGHSEIGQSLFQIGVVERLGGDLVQAEDFTQKAWEVYAQDASRGPTHGRTRFLWLHLAEIRLELGRAAEAKVMLDELPPEWWSSLNPAGQLLPLAQRVKGCTSAKLGELEEAENLLEQSLSAMQARFGDLSRETERVRRCLEIVHAKR